MARMPDRRRMIKHAYRTGHKRGYEQFRDHYTRCKEIPADTAEWCPPPLLERGLHMSEGVVERPAFFEDAVCAYGNGWQDGLLEAMYEVTDGAA